MRITNGTAESVHLWVDILILRKRRQVFVNFDGKETKGVEFYCSGSGKNKGANRYPQDRIRCNSIYLAINGILSESQAREIAPPHYSTMSNT